MVTVMTEYIKDAVGDEDALHNDARAHPSLMQSSILFQRTTCLVPNHMYDNHRSSIRGFQKVSESIYRFLLVAACKIGWLGIYMNANIYLHISEIKENKNNFRYSFKTV